MTDMLKQVTLAGKYKAEARLSDLAAKEMAKHCDKRIAAAQKALMKIRLLANGDGDRRLVIDKIFGIATEAVRALDPPRPSAEVTSQDRGTA